MHRYWDNGFNGNGFNGMMDFWNNTSGWFMVYDIIKFLIIVAVIVYIARLIITNHGKQKNSNTGASSNRAIDLLKERYAKGEIDEAEYEERLRNLKD